MRELSFPLFGVRSHAEMKVSSTLTTSAMGKTQMEREGREGENWDFCTFKADVKGELLLQWLPEKLHDLYKMCLKYDQSKPLHGIQRVWHRLKLMNFDFDSFREDMGIKF